MDGQVSVSVHPREPVLERVRRRFGEAPLAASIEMAARLGYAARAVVNLSVGLIAVLAVARLAPHTDGPLESLSAWAHWLPGIVLLWLTGLGLVGFAGWRVLQSVFDADRKGAGPKALAGRIAQGISGLGYGSLAISVFGLIHTLHSLRHVSEDARVVSRIAAVLELPLGSELVMALGGAIFAYGLGSLVRALIADFGHTFRCDPGMLAWFRRVARIGVFGRGLAFLPVGFFIFVAGWRQHAAEAHGVGGALWALHSQSLGDVVLVMAAVGLIAYGTFGFIEAWFRPIRPEAALTRGAAG